MHIQYWAGWWLVAANALVQLQARQIRAHAEHAQSLNRPSASTHVELNPPAADRLGGWLLGEMI
jgi:hypothetical protein